MTRSDIQDALGAGGGLLRLEPSWVPRSFMIPGERLKLHPRDLYALGGHRGGINERWFSSTTNADNGPGTPADEGLSYVRLDERQRFLLKEAVDDGRRPAARRRRDGAREGAGTSSASSSTTWGRSRITCTRATSRPSCSAARASPRPTTSRRSTTRPTTTSRTRSWASSPGTTKHDVRRCLENWNRGDNGILFLSRAFRLEPGTGWQIDPGILHAPGSLVTYEPQVNSDVFAMFQSEVEGRITPWELHDEGRAARASPRSRLPRRACSTGTPTSIRTFAADNRVLPDAGEAVRARPSPTGYREAVGAATAPAGTPRRS